MARPIEWYPARIKALAIALRRYTDGRIKSNKYPTVEGFTASQKISTKQYGEFGVKCEEFASAMEYLRSTAKDCLISGAMTDKFNASFSKFVAINCHGMRDATSVEHSGQVSHDIFLGNVIKRAAEGDE